MQDQHEQYNKLQECSRREFNSSVINMQRNKNDFCESKSSADDASQTRGMMPCSCICNRITPLPPEPGGWPPVSLTTNLSIRFAGFSNSEDENCCLLGCDPMWRCVLWRNDTSAPVISFEVLGGACSGWNLLLHFSSSYILRCCQYLRHYNIEW
jgi:hypothetical protein